MSAALDTKRLLLRQWSPDEALILLDIRRRPEVATWLGNPEPWATVEEAETHIGQWATRSTDDPPLGVWAIVPRQIGQPIGSIGLARLPGSQEVEIGWYVHPESTGNGFVTEAAERVLRHAHESGVVSVWAVMWPDNEPSAAVAQAIGMQRLGTRHDPWYGTEDHPDSLLFRSDASS